MIALADDIGNIGFEDTEVFELSPVQDGESQELKERAVKELKKSAIKEEIKTGAKPEWAENVKSEEARAAGQPDPDAGHDQAESSESPGEGPEKADEDRKGYQAPASDSDTTGLLEQFYDDLFKLLAIWTGWQGWRNTSELNQLYARNTGYFIKKLDPRIVGFLMLVVVTLGKILGFKEFREKQAKTAGPVPVDASKAEA